MKLDPRFLGFDIDGVVADTMEAFLRLAKQDHGISTIKPDDITCYMVEDCLDVDPMIIDAIFDRLLRAPLEVDLQPMNGAIRVLSELAGVAPLTFITARPQAKPIAAWLKRCLGEDVFDRASLVAMGEHDGKGEYVRKHGLKYFVDDRLQTCFQLEKQGVTPIVYNQPWNQGEEGFVRVDNWQGIHQLCFGP